MSIFFFARLISHVLGPVLNTLLGLKWHIRNAENFIEDGSIIVCNHQSALDFQGEMLHPEMLSLFYIPLPPFFL